MLLLYIHCLGFDFIMFVYLLLTVYWSLSRYVFLCYFQCGPHFPLLKIMADSMCDVY